MKRVLLATMAAALVLATAPLPHAMAMPLATRSVLPGEDGLVHQVGARGHAGAHRNAAANRQGGVNRNANVNRNVNRNANRNVNRNANRTVNGNVNRTVNRNVNVNRTVGVGGGWVRPSRFWWRPGGAIAAGAAIGFVSAATAVAWAGAAPGPDMCWYYTDESQQQGFWDQCP